MVDEKDKIILDLKLKLEIAEKVVDNLKSEICRFQVANVHLLKVIKEYEDDGK